MLGIAHSPDVHFSALTDKNIIFPYFFCKDSMAPHRKKVVALGDRDCGKTRLLNVFVKVKDRFLDDHFLDYFENCVADIEVDTKKVELVLWDIRGQEESSLSPMRTNMTYMDTDVFLLCFSIVDRDSLQSIIDQWAPEIRRFYPNVPSVLVGTKADTGIRNTITKENQMPVTVEEGRSVATRIGACAYVECSSWTRHGVDDVFQVAARAALQERERQTLTLISLFKLFRERFSFKHRR